jgi:dephospho-CoA kinase
MKIGLTGGIASGKTRFEEYFHELGIHVFNVDEIEIALRTGVDSFSIKDEFSSFEGLSELIKELSYKTIGLLQQQLPGLYDSEGKFRRRKLLDYINDKDKGSEYYHIYNDIINPPGRKIYQHWIGFCNEHSVLSSGVLIEKGYLSFIDKLIIIHASEDTQICNLLNREKDRKDNYSLEEARNAVRRQMAFEKRMYVAESALGQKNVNIFQYNEDYKNRILQIIQIPR